MMLHRGSRRGGVLGIIVARIRHIATTATGTATTPAFALLQTSFGFFMQKQFAGNVRFATRQRVPIHSAHRATIQHPFSNSFCVFTVFISASFSLLCAWDLRWKLAWGELNCAHAAFFRFSAYSLAPSLSPPSFSLLLDNRKVALFIYPSMFSRNCKYNFVYGLRNALKFSLSLQRGRSIREGGGSEVFRLMQQQQKLAFDLLFYYFTNFNTSAENAFVNY